MRVYDPTRTHNGFVLTIRNAVVEDVPAMLEMLSDSACDQGFEDEVGVTASDLISDGFGDNPKFLCVIAELDGQIAGMALFFLIYSTWGSKTVLYLEDLYVRRNGRNMGVARSLLEHLARVATEKGCTRIQWLVHAENLPAIRFYESIGARSLTDWTLMNLKDEAIEQLVIS